MERGRDMNGPQMWIEGEPDLESGSLEQWRAWRRRLARTPRHDETTRLAIAVADARIARLSRPRPG